VVREWHQGLYLITTDKASIDLAMIDGFLKTSCWTAGIPVRAIKRSVENSLTFGLFADEEEAGFARVAADTPPSTIPRRRVRLGASPRVGFGQLDDEGGVLAPRLAGF
jgi:hypothetical protein